MDLGTVGSMALKRRQSRTLEGAEALDLGVEKGLWDLQKPPRHRPDVTWLRKWAVEGKYFLSLFFFSKVFSIRKDTSLPL